MKIVALATCFNRKEATLSSIRDLQGQKLPSGVELSIVIVDDKSSDGTGDAVKAAFPSVQVVDGTGSLYWAGGMRYGWEHCVEETDFDALLVFNDDIKIEENALDELLKVGLRSEAAGDQLYLVSAAFLNSTGEQCSYGGFRHASKWHPFRFVRVEPNGCDQEVDAVNMNLTLIPRRTIDKIGFLAPYFLHAGADIEYGFRLRNEGGVLWLSPNALGRCDRNSTTGTSKEPGIHPKERWRRLLSVKEQPPGQRARYYREYGGLLWPLLWVMPYVNVLGRRLLYFVYSGAK